jgi:hypothetical protein
MDVPRAREKPETPAQRGVEEPTRVDSTTIEAKNAISLAFTHQEPELLLERNTALGV